MKLLTVVVVALCLSSPAFGYFIRDDVPVKDAGQNEYPVKDAGQNNVFKDAGQNKYIFQIVFPSVVRAGWLVNGGLDFYLRTENNESDFLKTFWLVGERTFSKGEYTYHKDWALTVKWFVFPKNCLPRPPEICFYRSQWVVPEPPVFILLGLFILSCLFRRFSTVR